LIADDRFRDAVARKVTEIEAHTDAEVVVVTAPRSGSYRDVAMAVGAIASVLTFGFLLAIPWVVHPALAVADLALAFVLVSWACDDRTAVVRLASPRRRERQVRLHAEAEFHREAVHATLRRTGLLVYVSAAEHRVELVPDVGLEARVPRAAWSEATTQLSAADLDLFLRGLDAVGAILAQHVPAVGERGVELSDAPRMRS
jgi:putative membrane protein